MASRTPLVLTHGDHSALTEKEIRAFAPVVFNDEPREGLSQSYMPVKSWDIITELRDHGYVPTEVQLRHRAGALDTTAHTIRFSQFDARSKMLTRGDVSPQLMMRNALDGSAHLEFWHALLRMLCSNGLIVSDSSDVRPLAVRHLASPTLAAIMAIQEISDQSKMMFQHIEAMRKTALSDKQQIRMAHGALALMNTKGAVQAHDLLTARRPEDVGPDVWRTFNRIQENIVRGGVNGKTTDNRPTRTRGLSGIGAQLNANTALWSLAMEAIGRASDSSKSAVRVLERARASEGTPAPARNLDTTPAPAAVTVARVA